MTREDEAYLSGWAHAARCMAIHKRDYTGALSARGAITGARYVQVPDAFDNGATDAYLAAFGHGDTDGANVGEFLCYCGAPAWRPLVDNWALLCDAHGDDE